jgi:hypothetical protein
MVNYQRAVFHNFLYKVHGKRGTGSRPLQWDFSEWGFPRKNPVPYGIVAESVGKTTLAKARRISGLN